MKKYIILLAAGIISTAAVAQDKVYLINKTNNSIVATFDRADVTTISFQNVLEAPVITSVTPASVKIGADITIAGENFSGVKEDNTVTIDGVACNIKSASTTELVVEAPSVLGTFPVVVTSNGKETTSADQVEIWGERISVVKNVVDLPTVLGGKQSHSFEFTADGKMLFASIDNPNKYYCYDPATGAVEVIKEEGDNWIYSMTRNGDKVMLAAKSTGKMLSLDLNSKEIEEVATGLSQILRVAIDAQGNAYALLRDDAKIYKFDGCTGAGKTLFADFKATDGQIWDMAFDANGNLLVAGNCALYSVAPDGTKTTIVGEAGVGSTNDELHDYLGNASTAHLQKPRMLCVDGRGYVWFQDQWNITRMLKPAADGSYQNGDLKIMWYGNSGQKTGETAQISVDPISGDVFVSIWSVGYNVPVQIYKFVVE